MAKRESACGISTRGLLPPARSIGYGSRVLATHRTLNLTSLAFLISALLLFVAFHLLSGFGSEDQGWRVWPEIWKFLQEIDIQSEAIDVILVSCFLSQALVVSLFPFLFTILQRSRVLWWLALILAGTSTFGIWIGVLENNSVDDLGSSGVALLAAPLVNLVGLLLLRGQPVEAGHFDPVQDHR